MEQQSVEASAQAEALTQAVMAWWQANADDGHRAHLGASIIGHPCERYLWNVFRWVRSQAWEGRMLRLFDDGKRAEARFIEELRGIGARVWAQDDAKQQFRVQAHAGHFGGSVDAIALGLSADPDTPHVCEFKTSNDKAFKDLGKKQVAAAKPMHYAQMQVYMGLMDLPRALYLVENKNDAALYCEIVPFDATAFARLLEKAQRIVSACVPPPRIADQAQDLNCRFCHFAPVCHGDAAPEVNCRTCARSTPNLQGTQGDWDCSLGEGAQPLTLSKQREGCEQHLYIPPLLSNLGEPTDGGDAYVAYRMADGREFVNGPAPNFSSIEIYRAEHKAMLADELVQQVKKDFPEARLLSAVPLADLPDDDLDQAPIKPTHPKEAASRQRIRATLDALQTGASTASTDKPFLEKESFRGRRSRVRLSN